MKLENQIRRVAEFHKNYENEFLDERIKCRTKYEKSPEEALFFILSYSFYQGRRDELSEKFEKNAKEALKKFLPENDPFSLICERMTDKDVLKARYRELDNLLKQYGVNKEGDRLMVISLINFIQSSNEKNLINFLIKQIKSKNVAEAHNKLDSIWSIGPKIASLILRDIVYIYELETYLNKEDYYFLQPIDTWVHKISKELELVGEDKIYRGEAKNITDKCFELEINPIHYNQGAWYIGSNSLQILLENIDQLV